MAAREELYVDSGFRTYSVWITISGSEPSLDEPDFEMFRFAASLVHAFRILRSVFFPRFWRVPSTIYRGNHQSISVFFRIRARFFYRIVVVGSQEDEIENVFPVCVSYALNLFRVSSKISTFAVHVYSSF
jgi:hypothetical protein